jgi:hypothetical protein
MVQRSDGSGFMVEARAPLGVGNEEIGEDFQRNVATEPAVAGAIDLAHAAGANGSKHVVLADARTNSEGHAMSLSRRPAILAQDEHHFGRAC